MSKIEWTDATWNPVIGCTPVSPGCLNCYAATMARRLEAMGTKGYEPRERVDDGPAFERGGVHRLEGVFCRCGGAVWYEDLPSERRELRWEAFCRKCKACDPNGYSSKKKLLEESPKFWGDHQFIRIAEVRGGRAVFTGEVRCLPERLVEPLSWKKPRMIFVNSMSDLFHEKVPFEFIDRVFAVMALCPWHTFQVLTKRPERMAEYMGTHVGVCGVRGFDRFKEAGRHGGVLGSAHFETPGGEGASFDWPLPNVWLGTSVESRPYIGRIHELARCPAAVHFISIEPLLESLGDIRPELSRLIESHHGDARRVWVIVGGESGHAARPMHPDWPESIRDQCVELGVPFFFKQWGEWGPKHPVQDPEVDRAVGLVLKGRPCPNNVLFVGKTVSPEPLSGRYGSVRLKDHMGEVMVRRGKKANGRMLGGTTRWAQMPAVVSLP